MNPASDMLVIQSLAFLEKKVAYFRKNLKIDNILYSIKNKTRQNEKVKYRLLQKQKYLTKICKQKP